MQHVVRHAATLCANRRALSSSPAKAVTGKEMSCARAIHAQKTRGGGAQVLLSRSIARRSRPAWWRPSCSATRKALFTGAAARTRGQVEHAHGGTLFLDEIGDMPVDLQGHLLRFLQEGQIVRVGGRENDQRRRACGVGHQRTAAPGDGRRPLSRRFILSAQCVDAATATHCANGPKTSNCSRAIFYVRPPRIFAGEVVDFTPEAMEILRHYHWPGNVRDGFDVNDPSHRGNRQFAGGYRHRPGGAGH